MMNLKWGVSEHTSTDMALNLKEKINISHLKIFFHKPLEKNELTRKQKAMVAMEKHIRNRKMINGLVFPMTRPSAVFIVRKMVMIADVINKKMKYLVNQATQCNQLFSPIIFMDSWKQK